MGRAVLLTIRQTHLSAATFRWCTLLAEFGEEAEAGDRWSCEDDGVLSRNVLTQLLGHEAVELRLVLQGGQTVCALPLFQMDVDLQNTTRRGIFNHTYRSSK